jgi:AcrR family transcriptional regulator
MPPWPGGGEGSGKRERTRGQLLQAAMQVFSARGVALASLQEVAAVAGVANGTVYNHFASKDELVEQVALWLAMGLCEAIDASSRDVAEGAERMAIGNRRYLWFAQHCPAWAMLLLDIGAAEPKHFEAIGQYPLADLRLGHRQKAFRFASEAAAMDLVAGTVMRGMQTVAAGQAPKGHAEAVAATVLMGLGVAREDAIAIAKRPLPPFRPAAA